MGEVRRRRRRFKPGRELWLQARVNPVAFTSGKTCHIIRAVDANLEREWTWISNDQRPQAWKPGLPKADHGNQPDKNDHPSRLTPQWARLG